MMKCIISMLLIFALLSALPACSTHKETEVASSTAPSSVVSEPESAVESAPEPIPEPAAERISDGFKVLINSADLTSVLSDEDHYSKRYIKPQDTLAAESGKPFSSLYIKWDRIPGSYKVSWNGGSLICGKNGFLHEYVRLPVAVESVKIESVNDKTLLLCDIEAYTAGSIPEGVQDWLMPCETADILVFPTHSDDDALFFGALMSYYIVERGLTVQTAFMVDHTYYPERGHERLNGLWEMGIRHYPVLGSAPDTATHDMSEAMNLYAPSDIPGWQIEQIRRFKPLVIAGHDLNGEYGNGGHKVNSHYLTQAVDLANDPKKYPESAEKYGVWNTPKLYLHLYEKNRITLDVTTPLKNDPHGRSAFEIAEDAFEHHKSQRKGNLRVCLEDEELPRYDCRLFGLYRSLVGNDTAADIMENIDSENGDNFMSIAAMYKK